MKILRRVGIALLLLLAVYLLLPDYLRTALTYFTPNIDDYTIFENRIVEGGTAQAWPLHPEYNKARLPDSLQLAIEELEPVALLLLKEGQILHEQYWDGYTDSSYSNSFSMAKSIVGLLIGIAEEEGHIKSLEEPVTNYLPDFKGASLSIKELLIMSSGLSWDEAYSSPFSVTTQAYYGDELRELMHEQEVVEKPGKVWNYKSGNTQLLAMILEKATSRSLSEYASDKLWKPMGAHQKALWSLDRPDGIEKAYCCFNSNARDFARLGQLVLDSGAWQGQQLVPKAFLQEALTPARQLVDEEGKPVDFYGYHWWLLQYKGEMIPYARGILGQYIIVLPKERAVLVRLGHERSDERIDHHPAEVFTYLKSAESLLSNF